jgi:hypothetical protein
MDIKRLKSSPLVEVVYLTAQFNDLTSLAISWSANISIMIIKEVETRQIKMEKFLHVLTR